MFANEEQKVTVITGVRTYKDVDYKPTLPEYNIIQELEMTIKVRLAIQLQPNEKDYENMSNELEAAKQNKKQFELIYSNNKRYSIYVSNCDCDKDTKTISVLASSEPPKM